MFGTRGQPRCRCSHLLSPSSTPAPTQAAMARGCSTPMPASPRLGQLLLGIVRIRAHVSLSLLPLVYEQALAGG